MDGVARVSVAGSDAEAGSESETHDVVNGNHGVEIPTRPDQQIVDNDEDTDSDSSSSSDSPTSISDYHQTKRNKGCVQDAIIHLFLPKRIPDGADVDIVYLDEWILERFHEVFYELQFPTLSPINKMLETWRSLQPKTSFEQDRFVQRFCYEMRGMEVGDAIPIYVRKQNCTVIFTKLDEKGVQVETFRPGLPSETIMSTIGSLQVTFPETSDVIHNTDLLASEAFAIQLHELSVEHFEASMRSSMKAGREFVEHREVPEPFLVTDWLVGLLVPASNRNSQKIKIVKKIRDDVNCNRSAQAIPFRRSGTWTSIKVTLHLKLVQLVGNENDATILYKTILLHFYAEICKLYSESRHKIDVDLCSQLLAKLGRRVKKLQKMSCDKKSKYAKEIVSSWTACIKFVYSVVSVLNQRMKSAWSESSASENIIAEPILRTSKEFHQDLLHHIPWLDELITDTNSKDNLAKAVQLTNFTAENLKESLQLQRYRTLSSILGGAKSLFSISDTVDRIWLYDTEHFMKNCLDNETDSKLVLDVFAVYVKNAVRKYTTSGVVNPVGYSQVQLVALKVIQLLDKIATKKFPLLRQYNVGIDASNFDKLLLPHADDMALLEKTLDYVADRDRVAYHPSIIETNDIQPNSFAVRVAQDNEEMIDLHRKIYSDTEQRIADKFSEVEKVKAECKQLRKEIKKLKSCTDCKYDTDHLEMKTEKCDKCSKLELDLERMRVSVSRFERPLPEEDHFQQAVIFELLVPAEISHLREALALLKFDILGHPVFRGKQKHSSSSSGGPMKWIDYKLMQEYRAKEQKESVVRTLNLCSKLLPTSNTHHTRIKNPDVLSSETSNNDFIVSNGLDCVYHYKPQCYGISKGLVETNLSTFQIHNTTKDKEDLYSDMQWAVNSTAHNQNRVIAENTAILFPELIAFGSLRAGHRIQLMNLYRYITNRELALEKEPVLALILQTLWQLGPRDKHDVRESHIDFIEDTGLFSLEFLEMLEKLMENNDTNYANPLILLTVVVITCRVLELNRSEEARSKCLQLLRNSRKYVDKWWELIENEISQACTADEPELSNCEEHEGLDVKRLHTVQLQIAICSALSYNVSESLLFTHVIHESDDVLHWLRTLSRLHQLTEEAKCQNELSPFFQLLVRLAKNIAFKIDLEMRIGSNPVIPKCLHLFSCENWDKAASCCIKEDAQLSWKPNESSSHLLFGEYIEENGHSHLLTYDLILGTFLVNGYTQSGLSSMILHYPLYELYFRGNKLRVQGYHPRRVRTVSKFHGRHYEFATFSISSKVTIREVQDDGGVLELLDPVKFRGFIADCHIDSYTHWVDANKKEVYFRRCPQNDSDYSATSEFKLVKKEDTNMWHLVDESLHQFVFSRKSPGFLLVSGALSRLEIPEFVNVVMDENTETVTAKLPRYHLSFNVAEGRLFSVEYVSFKLSSNQGTSGTLVGLQQGILLDNHGNEPSSSSNEEDNKETGKYIGKQLLLVPHGKLTIEMKQSNLQHFNNHQRTTVELGHLRQPPFFVFEFDPVLKGLRADKNKAAWLYLAALHGATASPLPDPYTEITGTEAAVQILQSGFVWSCYPYDEECLATLRIIRKFSPRRYYYGHGLRSKKLNSLLCEQMETTEWPAGLPSMAAYDGYAIIVDKLIQDSYRLSALHPASSQGKFGVKDVDNTSEKLQLRGYYRHLTSYNKAVALKPMYFSISAEKLNQAGSLPELATRRKMSESHPFSLSELEMISQFRSLGSTLQEGNSSRRGSALSSFLLAEEGPLLESMPISNYLIAPLKQLLAVDFRENWLKFYRMAVTWTEPHRRHAFTMILSSLAYQGAPVEQLINLHNIGVLAERISLPMLPQSLERVTFSNPNSNEFSVQVLKSQLLNTAVRINYEGGEARLQVYQDQLEVQDKIDYVVKQLQEMWPCDQIPRTKIEEMVQHTKLWSYSDFHKIGRMMREWNNNSKLKSFVDNLEKILDKFYEHMPKPQNSAYQFDRMSETTLEIRVVPPAESAVEKIYEDIAGLIVDGNLDEAGIIFYSGTGFQESNVEALIESQREECVAKIASYSQLIYKSLSSSASKQVVLMAGLAPRTSPPLLLQYLLHGLRTRSLTSSLLKCIGALAVLWTELKRFNRCLALKSHGKGDTTFVELKSELENKGHDNWSPVDHPEWLLLELELDIMIRPVQVDVARQMLRMPDGRNGVMQLNMGEGKTSVVVPMLCSTLSNEESLCRVTVLNSIFKTNLTILSFAVGGLLNKRVYTFPCRRDLDIDEKCLASILSAYLECLRLRGVVLTLPEYRLSFRQMAYDKTLKGYPDVGVKFIDIENGLRKYARDVLDESDELLSVKYQLVYTIGSQVAVDGGKLRWVTCQKLLQVVQSIAEVFLEKMGPRVVEFHSENQEKHPEQFAHIRLLDSNSGMDEFLGLLADEVLKEFKLTERQKQVVKKFLTQQKISSENFKFVMSLFKHDASLLDEIRILSGYFQRGILALALSKRWRVEYGVDPRGHRKMAVPFRAKDFAAERTEFGHPDLAIILTQLSYYYSGLCDSQLQDCFDILKSVPEASTIYATWVEKIPLENVPKFLLSYDGINLQDAYQRSRLFEMLRKHKGTIDFWLSHKVYPQECKQFPGKIVMTAWDLCNEQSRNPISGFSGTNDSSILLPLPVSQQDLPQLQNTNAKMEKTLLKPENGTHKGFRMGVTCREILEEMKTDGLQVLIDAGAIMLECNNDEVAKLWLEVEESIEAVVYFNIENELVVKCRTNHDEDKKQKLKDMPLELSPYRERLGKCGVFLDDQHTRGTDLKFPVGSKACVTIGSRMRRDKLMQACMRMRKLGSGHSVAFYLSHEAHTKVLQLKGKVKGKKKNKGKTGDQITAEIGTQEVINWVSQNTLEYNHDGLVYWAIAGKNYAQKVAAQEFHDSVDSNPLERVHTLANQCLDDEVLLLKDLYGTHSEVDLLSRLIPEWFESTQRRLQTADGCCMLSQRIVQKFDSIRDAVQKRCKDHIPDRTYISGMMVEEEQEKELEREKEVEVEQERQVVRPDKVDGSQPSLNEHVRKTVLNGGKISPKSESILRLCEIFEKTSYWKLIQPECWGGDVYATKDFISVIKSYDDQDQNFKTDSYLRPIEYFASSQLPSGNLQLIVLSPFEVNELMPYFRKGKTEMQLHMFATRRFLFQDILVNSPHLQVPRPHVRSPVTIPEESKAVAALLLASGNLYFGSMEEQKAFARFLALVPRPWSSEQSAAFEKEMIKKTGFLLPKYRKQQQECCQIDLDSFQKDPIGMTKKILISRHKAISEVAHVSRLLNHNWLIELDLPL